MKKHELLKHAYDNYPKGTIFWWPNDTIKNKLTSSGVFYIGNSKWIYDKNDTRKAVFNGDKWAEIITEQSHTLKVSGAEKTTSFEVYETELRLNVNSQTFVFTKDFLEKHLLPALKVYKKLKFI